MKVSIDRETLRQDLNKIRNLFYGFAGFVVLGFLGELFSGGPGFLGSCFWAVVIAMALRSFRQVLFNFQYTFWTFSLCFLLYIFSAFVGADNAFVFNCYLIAFVLLLILCWTLGSPLFYPRITWWEYDFRFQGELKITAHLPDSGSVPGRLTDLRRMAGCIVLFEELPSGTEFTIDYEHPGGVKTYLIKVMSRRSAIPGRGYIYGVQFLFAEDSDRERFEALSELWKFRKKARRLAKFQNAS